MAKKPAETKKPEPSQRDLAAMACGCLSGTSDHIARMQQELVDIAGRCSLIRDFLGKMPEKVSGNNDVDFLLELKGYCENRFGNLHDMRKRIEAILEKVNQYKP
jgi:hypothetical protein